MDSSAVGRTVQLFRCTGNVCEKQYNATNLPCKLSDTIQFLQYIPAGLERPEIMVHEIQARIEQVTEVELAASIICQFLHNSGFSRQRMRLAALSAAFFEKTLW